MSHTIRGGLAVLTAASTAIALVLAAVASNIAVAAAPVTQVTAGTYVAPVPAICTINSPKTDEAGEDVTRAGAPCSKITILLGTNVDGTGALPKVGEDGHLIVKVESDPNATAGRGATSVTIPPGMRFTGIAKDFATETMSDPFGFSDGGGHKGDGSAAAAARGDVAIVPGGSVTLEFAVHIDKGGAGTIEAGMDGPEHSAGSIALFAFTYTEKGSTPGTDLSPQLDVRNVEIPIDVTMPPKITSSDGMCPGGASGVDLQFCPGVASLNDTSGEPQKEDPNANPGSGAKEPTARTAATTCTIGRFVYSDQAGVVRPSVNLVVRAEDDNAADSDTVASGVTDGDGRFRLCFDNEEHSIVGGGTADVRLVFKTENSRYRVMNRCCADSGWSYGPYEIRTSVRDNVPAGTIDYGNMTTGDGTFQRALHLYDELNQGWQFANVHTPSAGDCWGPGDCDRKTAMWSNGSDTWPHYGQCAARAGSYICMPANGPDWIVVAEHELGHNVMDDIYSGGIPSHECPNPHFGNTNEQPQCAWIEGWPSWFANAVLGQNLNAGYGGQSQAFMGAADNDTSSWQNYTSAARGDNSEDRIQNALWDLADSANADSPWDRMALGHEVIWRAFISGSSSTFSEFVSRVGSTQGVDFGASSPARSTLYGNTIDLNGAFRDPLATTWAHRPMPPVSPPTITSTPSGSTAMPTNTTNDQSFVWERPLRASMCPDLVEAMDTWNQPTLYRATADAANTFRFSNFGIDAYSDAALRNRIATSPRVAIQSLPASLELPQQPRRVYLKVSGTAATNDVPGTGIAPGNALSQMLTLYKIRGSRCLQLQPGTTTTFDMTNVLNTAVLLRRGVDYVLRVRPSGPAAVVKDADISLRLYRGRHCRKLASAAKCIFHKVVVRADRTGLGQPERLKYTPRKKGIYRLLGTTKNGKPIKWRVTLRRQKR